jgi:hypothetical protein
MQSQVSRHNEIDAAREGDEPRRHARTVLAASSKASKQAA